MTRSDLRRDLAKRLLACLATYIVFIGAVQVASAPFRRAAGRLLDPASDCNRVGTPGPGHVPAANPAPPPKSIAPTPGNSEMRLIVCDYPAARPRAAMDPFRAFHARLEEQREQRLKRAREVNRRHLLRLEMEGIASDWLLAGPDLGAGYIGLSDLSKASATTNEAVVREIEVGDHARRMGDLLGRVAP